MSSDEELEEIRRRRMIELRRQLADEQRKAELQQQVELQKQALLRRILTTTARQRLNRIKMVRPQFADQLELQLIQLAQTGNIRLPITDDQLKTILMRLHTGKREVRFRYR
ncbi:MAG: DNA-binding protein [Candidatus Bathyarchaeia archaeon]